MRAHIYGPNYTCPGSELNYYSEDDYGGGNIEISVVHGEIFNEVTQAWVTYWEFYEGDYNFGTPSFPYKIRWDNSPLGTVGHVHITVCDHTATWICSSGDRYVTFGPSPGTPTINGSDYLLNCQSQQQSYTVSNLPESWVLDSWTVSSNLQKSGFNPVNVQGTSTTYQGMEALTGVFKFKTDGNTCGTQNSVKNIWLGKPNPGNQTLDGSTYYAGYQICPGSHWVGISWTGLVSSTSWSVTPGISWYANNTECDFTLPSSGFSGVDITVNATNACGTSYNTSYYLSKKMSGCGSFMVAAFPNPSKGELTVQTSFVDDKQSETAVVPDEVALIDKLSQMVISKIPAESRILLDTRNIPNGEYFLKVSFGTEKSVSRIIIENQ